MLSSLDNNKLESLLRALEAAPPPLPGAEHTGISSILSCNGVGHTLANQIELALTAGHFDLPTLKSAIAFALSQKLHTIQILCVGSTIFGGLLAIALFLIANRISLWIVLFIIAGFVTTEKFSRQRRLIHGKREDFQTVEQRAPQSSALASQDLY